MHRWGYGCVDRGAEVETVDVGLGRNIILETLLVSEVERAVVDLLKSFCVLVSTPGLVLGSKFL